MPAATSLRLIWSVRRSVVVRPARSSCCSISRSRWIPVQWSHTRGYSTRVHRPLSATRCAPPARRGRSALPDGSPKARSSPTRSTSEYADSMPRARISRDPTSTWPASATHGRSASAAISATPYGHLAGPAGEVEGALPGDHQVGLPGPLREPDVLGDQVDARLAAWRRARSSAKPMPPAAPAPLSSDVRRSVAAAKRLQPAVDLDDLLLGDALLRAEGLGGAEQAGERVVDVGGGHQGDAAPAARGPGRGRPW